MIGDILQPTHLLFVLIVALLVLGPKRLPEMARTLGSGLRDFRAAINGERDDGDTPAKPDRRITSDDEPIDSEPMVEGIGPPERTPAASEPIEAEPMVERAGGHPQAPTPSEPGLDAAPEPAPDHTDHELQPEPELSPERQS